MFDFEKLDVYNLALDFCQDVEDLVKILPKQEWSLADQLKRASLSIPLNIAEGSGRISDKERKHYFSVSRGSVFECVPILTLLVRRDFMNRETHSGLREKLSRLTQMLVKLIQKFDT